jgi:hypothetical protein
VKIGNYSILFGIVESKEIAIVVKENRWIWVSDVRYTPVKEAFNEPLSLVIEF